MQRIHSYSEDAAADAVAVKHLARFVRRPSADRPLWIRAICHSRRHVRKGGHPGRVAAPRRCLCADAVVLTVADYLTVTFAPAASREAFAFSAASLVPFSMTAFGAPSTRSLASFSPRLVSSRTALMTWIFWAPASSRMTSNSSCSSAASAARAAAGRAGRGDRDRCGSGDAEGVLELLHELGELKQRELLERVDQIVGAELRHGGGSFLE